MHDAILEADLVESGFGDRFIRVPHQDSHESYGAMEEFIETVTNPRVKHRLASAIRGRGAFSRFRDVLTSAPAERERWSAFHQD